MPQGVVCLLSALQFHGLTTKRPPDLWLAIEEKAWRPRLDYPPLRVVYFSGNALTEGIETHTIQNVPVRVYNVDKTIADCFKYRNKAGLDVSIEALHDGWRRRQTTIMSSPTRKKEVEAGQKGESIPATEWDLIVSASRENSSEGDRALEALCRQYWYPIYAYVRHAGYGIEDAKDLTQEFFSRLLSNHTLAAADPAQGRFRNFLRVSLRNFLANEWDKSHAAKRGGGKSCISFDGLAAEERYAVELSHEPSPDSTYDRAWACMIIDSVRRRLREHCIRKGKGEQFEILERCMSEDHGSLPYSALAQQLGITESAVKSVAYRFRQRFAMALHGEIARTVPRQEDIDEELRRLVAALTGA